MHSVLASDVRHGAMLVQGGPCDQVVQPQCLQRSRHGEDEVQQRQVDPRSGYAVLIPGGPRDQVDEQRAVPRRGSRAHEMRQQQVGPRTSGGNMHRTGDRAMWTDGPLLRHNEELVQATTYGRSEQACNSFEWTMRAWTYQRPRYLLHPPMLQ